MFSFESPLYCRWAEKMKRMEKMEMEEAEGLVAVEKFGSQVGLRGVMMLL